MFALAVPVSGLADRLATTIEAQEASAPARPTGLTADPSHNLVALSWEDPGDASITHYEVFRRDRDVHASGEFEQIVANTGSAATSYTDDTAQPLSRYRYRIKAVNRHGASQRSRFTGADTPEAPVEDSQRDTGPVTTTEDSAGIDDGACPDRDTEPTPVNIQVDAVPIVVTSTTADYFVLYVTFDLNGAEVEQPVLVKRGATGATTLTENVEALPKERYRVEKYRIAAPADIDHDCVDDLTELNDLGKMNPLNPAPVVASVDGAVAIPDLQTFESLARDNQGKSYVTYVQFDIDTSTPGLYLLNTAKYPVYGDFMDTIGRISDPNTRVGSITYDPDLVAANGDRGAFYFTVGPYADYLNLLDRTHTLLAANIPLVDHNLSLHVQNYRLGEIQTELTWLMSPRFGLVVDTDIRPGSRFTILHAREGYGRLRLAAPGYQPDPLDIVIYEAQPETYPRLAGVITTFPQTPLSPSNLRALQGGIPNAVIADAANDAQIAPLIDSVVRFQTSEYGWVMQAATSVKAEAHYESSRPANVQIPARDLTVTEIKALSEIGFSDRSAFGVQAANVAVLEALGIPSVATPDGFAIPFYFYDEFMNAHGFDDRIEAMLTDEEFQSDYAVQATKLQELRDAIEAAASPSFIIDALTAKHAEFPPGTMLRYRPSTNSEDFPNFNGSGLYDARTQDLESTDIDRSFKQVIASLWTFRAFTEREFHRIDHLSAAMGMLVYLNISSADVNGSAVSFDPLNDSADTYYLNAFPSQEHVTKLVEHPSPEEWLLASDKRYRVAAPSNQVASGTLLLNNNHLEQLRQHLRAIHDRFEQLYNPSSGASFAMEIAFKISSEDGLVIEQARPWVFRNHTTIKSTRTTTLTTSRGGGGSGGGGGGPPPVPIPSDADFDWNVTRDIESLDRDNDLPTDIWSDGVTLWVLENSASGADRVFAYELQTGERQPDAEFELESRNRFSHGIWSDSQTVWIADSSQDMLFAYDLASGERLAARDIELAESNRDPRGIWSDGDTLYVLDSVKDALFVYDLETGELLAEYPLDKLNKSPRGIWSDGITIWVSDDGAKRLFAYRVEEGALARHKDEEFTFRSLLKAGNGDARGIWSDGDVMYVVDEQDDKVYSYNIPDAIDARLAALSLSDVQIDEFSASRPTYTALAERAATVTTVEALAAQEAARVVIEPSDTDGDAENGHQVALGAETEITITVTSSDGSRTRSYRVLIEKPTCLTGLTTERLSEVTFVGGSVDDLERCARERGVTAFLYWTGESWLLYAPGAPEFLSHRYLHYFASGIPAGAPLIAVTTGEQRTDS